MNRRELLQAGVAVAAVPLAGAGVQTARAGAPPIYKAVFDERYADCRAFGEEVARNGIAVQAIADGDVTRFWFDELDLLWQEKPVAIAGLTQFGPMFVLERLGRERGLRVALRVEHRPGSDGLLRHVMSGHQETLVLAARLDAEGMRWPSVMAGAITACPSDCSAPGKAMVLIGGTTPEIDRGTPESTHERRPERIIHYYMTHGQQTGLDLPTDGPLFSWVIAPKMGA